MTSSGQFWIENVLEEVDDAREYYYDETLKRLYYNPNSTTEGPTGAEEWVATQTRALINISGTMEAPVTDVTIRGLGSSASLVGDEIVACNGVLHMVDHCLLPFDGDGRLDGAQRARFVSSLARSNGLRPK